MKKIISVIICLALVLSFSGCSDFPKSEADLNESQVPSELKVSHLSAKAGDKAQFNLWYDMNLIMAVHYPAYGNSFDDSILKTVNDIRGDFTKIANGFQAKKFKKRGTLYVDYETFQKDTLLSVVFHISTINMEENDLNESVRTLVFDTNSSRIIDDGSYFKTTYTSFVNGIASEELSKAAKEQKVSDFAYKTLDKFSKFAVKTDGVEFYFSKSDLPGFKKAVSFKISENNIKDYVSYGKIDPNKPMIAITFDDGPGANTDKILDVLEKYNAKATFFMVGECLAESKASLLKRMVSLDCEIGSHSSKHDDLSAMSASAALSDIQSVTKEIKQLTGGYECKLYRPPYGAYTSSLIETTAANGLTAINWSVDTLDWKYRDSSWVYQQATKAEDGDIVLMHDIHKTTVAAVEDIVKNFTERGYQLITVSELMQQRNVTANGKPILACYKSGS